MFFDVLPEISYKFGKEYRDVENIVLAVNPVDDVYSPRYFDSTVINEQSPEELSNELYGDTHYYWVLLYINKIVNPYDDWVKPISYLHDYCSKKYGEENVLAPAYFIDVNTNRKLVGVAEDRCRELWKNGEDLPNGINLITNYEYEQMENDKKRYIRYVSRSKLISFVDNFETALRNSIK